MKLGNQVEWAIHCMELLARAPGDIYIPTKVLAKFHGIPKEYLSKAMQSLALSNIVEGTLGPKGGYRIAKDPSKINLLEIVEALEGKKRTFNCQEIRFNNPCLKKEQKKKGTTCMIASAMYQADEAWRKVLRNKKLSDIVSDADAQVPIEILDLSEEWIINEMN
jgi:Rrf2 family protein